MRPLEFLREECRNVDRALQETLRHDYGPELTAEFYEECASRLDKITRQVQPGAITDADHQKIAALLADLSYLASLIVLIERSHLGEFSWPFADELRLLAKKILVEPDLLGGTNEPIVHVVSDGRGYRIRNEDIVQSTSSHRRFTIVLFPRQFKDHVLLHAIFGHELGHAALSSTQIASTIQSQVFPALGSGVLASDEAATEWLCSDDAPTDLKAGLAAFQTKYGEPFVLLETLRNLWLHEFICDLFGLLLFGPAFLAAHRSIIEPSHPDPLKVDLLEPTHPPYGTRHALLVQAMRLLQWHKTITMDADGDFHLAELKVLTELTEDHAPRWARIFSEKELDAAIKGIQAGLGDLGYAQLSQTNMLALLGRLKNSLPPILDAINPDGSPRTEKADFRQILHAGWVFWGGRDQLKPPSELSFLQTNQLCNQALLQQRAINEFAGT
jgi:hypothetical protein